MTLIELFSGAGGAALGLKAAGFEGPHVEIDPDAVATLHAAGFASALEADASSLDCSGWESPDLLWASPPCQAFSTAGKRLGALDDRNGWPWTLRIVDQVRPRWVVCENVPGLVQHSGETCGDPNRCPGCYWLRVILPSYRDRFPWVGVWKLNAADYGVPQTRRRVFLVAGPHPVKPPQSSEARQSLEQALGRGIVDAERRAGNRQRLPNEPARTIGTRGNAMVLANGVRRRLTVEECATLQGFPAGYPFQGTKTAQYRQVGNAVPPILAQWIAEAINHAEKEATP